MKKITFILLALISVTAFAQEQKSAKANVKAQIVSPIQIESVSALNFGTINGTSTGGDVTVDWQGERTFQNSAMDIKSAEPITAATFNITASENYTYSISVPSTVLQGPNKTEPEMALNFTHNRVNAGNRVGTGSSQSLSVGGVLTVNGGQPAGTYSGEVEVTVAYE